jgi:hypothetical protein
MNSVTWRLDYVPIDFTPTSETSYQWERGGGCECSQNTQIAFPNGPYTAAPNEEFLFRYDGSQICRKQSIKDFQGTVDWGPTITRLHDFVPWTYWAIAGTLKVKFPAAGAYNVLAQFSVTCFDYQDPRNKCEKTCRAQGTTQVRVVEKIATAPQAINP